MLASKTPGFWFGFLRTLVGLSWLINGLDKILDPQYDSMSLRPMLETWSATGQGALGAFVGSTLLPHVEVVGFVLKAGELLLGLALIVGLFGRVAAFAGFIIIAGAWAFKDAYDVLSGYAGADFVVMATMLFLTFAPSATVWRIDRVFIRNRPARAQTIAPPPASPPVPPPPVAPPPVAPPPVGTPV